jgi:hypothetical protein
MNLLINQYNRILYDDNSTFAEHSEAMRTWRSLTMGAVLTLNEDYIYVGCPHTFASRFICMDGVNINSISAALTVEYYYGKDRWRSVKNFRDETRSGNATLGKSGFIMWDLPTDWVANQVNSVPELPYGTNPADTQGYYWIRIKSSATLSAGTAIKWLGVLWTHQDYLAARWPEVATDTYLPDNESDWYPTIEIATGDVADDLNINNIIDYELQVKDISDMAKLTALKALDIILTPLTASETLSKMKDDFKKHYDKLLGKRLKGIDLDGDETLRHEENKPLVNSRIRRA